jgi:hypothetical protein
LKKNSCSKLAKNTIKGTIKTCPIVNIIRPRFPSVVAKNNTIPINTIGRLTKPPYRIPFTV